MDFEKLNVSSNEQDGLQIEVSEKKSIATVNDYGMNAEVRSNVPGVERAIVIGNPEETAQILDSIQGDAIEGAEGTCGLTSIANLCVMNGQNVTEGMVVEYALENDLCMYDPWSAPETGGTTAEWQVDILRNFGIEAEYNDASINTYEVIADAIEDGKGVIVELDAGKLWDEPSCSSKILWFFPTANHAVTVTGVARNAETGEITGFYICDSGRQLESDACRYIPIDDFSKAYNSNIINAGAVITNEPIRA